MLIKIVRFLAPDVDDLQSMTAAKWSKVAISLTKYAISTFLFAVCVLVSMALTENPVRIILIWVLIGYLAALEGGQVAMVSLASVPSASYKRSHPRTARCMAVVEKQSVMEQYIMGRQFLVVIVIFLLNIVSSGSNTCHDIALGGFSDAASAICNTGLTLTFVTIMVAQITSQIIASNCRLDFLNKFLMLGNTWLALAIEYSGILHTVHLVRILLSRVSGDDTNETPGVNVLSLASNAAKFFWLRVGLSLFLLWFSVVAIFHEVLLGHTDSMGSAPGYVNMIIVFVFMGIIGLYEGLQIALCALAHVDMTVLKETYPMAASNCQLTFGSNLESFLIGRQMFVTVFVFFVAGTTTISEDWKQDKDYTTFHLGSETLQALLTSGLPASLITTILGSLIFRSAAAKNPVAYLSNPIIGPAIRICLLVESTGVMQFSWVLSKLFMQLLRMRPDSSLLSGPQIIDTPSTIDTMPSSEVRSSPLHNQNISVRSPESPNFNRRVTDTPSPRSVHIPISSGPDSLYRSIFTTESTAEGVAAPLAINVPSEGGWMNSEYSMSPPTRERGASIQQVYAATMITSAAPSPISEIFSVDENYGLAPASPLTTRLVVTTSNFGYSNTLSTLEGVDEGIERNTSGDNSGAYY